MIPFSDIRFFVGRYVAYRTLQSTLVIDVETGKSACGPERPHNRTTITRFAIDQVDHLIVAIEHEQHYNQ